MTSGTPTPKLPFVLCILTAVVALAVVPLRASDPVGAYCIVDKVVLEPNSTEPQTAQVFGVFSFAVPRNRADFSQPFPAGSFGVQQTGDVYAAVQKGYLYYTCPKGRDASCQAEWNDLKSVAGKGEVVGFGTRYGMTGRVRPANEAPTAPDVYPLNVGVVKMGNSKYSDLVTALVNASKSK